VRKFGQKYQNWRDRVAINPGEKSKTPKGKPVRNIILLRCIWTKKLDIEEPFPKHESPAEISDLDTAEKSLLTPFF